MEGNLPPLLPTAHSDWFEEVIGGMAKMSATANSDDEEINPGLQGNP